MRAILAVFVTIVSFLICALMGDLFSREARARLDRLPHRLLKIAAWRLPARSRAERLEEWEGELHEILREADALPLTRLGRGVRYAAGLIYAAPRMARYINPPGRWGFSPSAAGKPRIVRRVLISLALGGVAYAASALADETGATYSGALMALILGVFLGGVALVVQFLIEFDGRVAALEQQADTAIAQTEPAKPTPPLRIVWRSILAGSIAGPTYLVAWFIGGEVLLSLTLAVFTGGTVLVVGVLIDLDAALRARVRR